MSQLFLFLDDIYHISILYDLPPLLLNRDLSLGGENSLIFS